MICLCCGKEIPDGEKKCVFCGAEIAEQTDVKQESAKRVTAVPESRITCPTCGSHNVRIEMVPKRIVRLPLLEEVNSGFSRFLFIVLLLCVGILLVVPVLNVVFGVIFGIVLLFLLIWNENNIKIVSEKVCVCQECGQKVELDADDGEKDEKTAKV